MELVCHGGHCCGIKHIYELGHKPSTIRYQKEKPATNALTYSNGAGETTPGRDAFFDVAPKEKAWQRLDRYIKYLDEKRSKGVIEVVTVSGKPGASSVEKQWLRQNKNWRKTLLRRGFREVNTCENVNSGAILHIWHRNGGEVPLKVKKEKKNGKRKGGENSNRPEQPVSQTFISPFD